MNDRCSWNDLGHDLEGLNESLGVLLVGHGTRDETGTAEFFELASRLAGRLNPVPVESGLLEFQEPTIPQAWQALVARGVKRIRVAPLLLFAAGHAKQDIPDILMQCQAQTTAVTFDQVRPISRQRAMIELASQRLAETLDRVVSKDERTAVVMVGRGSHDPCAQADMRVLSEVVSRRFPLRFLTTAFYAMAEPRLPDVLDRLAESERFDTIVVQPHLLFEGRLYRAILNQVEEAALRHRSIEWKHSRYLGPNDLVAEALAGRILSA